LSEEDLVLTVSVEEPIQGLPGGDSQPVSGETDDNLTTETAETEEESQG
jgi:hypothetical protein